MSKPPTLYTRKSSRSASHNKGRNPFAKPAVSRNRTHNQKQRFSLFPLILAGLIILGGAYWVWSYGGDIAQSPLLSWVTGSGAAVFRTANGISQTEARDKYTQALEAQNAEEYDLAQRLFLELEESYPGLKPLIAWHLAAIHQKQPQENAVQLRLQHVLETPNLQDEFKARTQYELMRSYIRGKQPELAREASQKLKKEFPKSDYAYASMYYEGLMLQQAHAASTTPGLGSQLVTTQLPADVRKLWLDYLRVSPTGTFAIPIIEALETHNYPPSVEDMSHYIQAFTHAKKYTDALRIANKKAYSIDIAGLDVIESTLQVGNRKQAITYLLYWLPSYKFEPQRFRDIINLVFPLKEKPTEAQLALLKQLHGLARHPENKEWLLWQLTQLDKPHQAQWYGQYLAAYPTAKFAPFVESELIRLQFNQGQNTKVISMAQAFLKKYPASLEAPDVHLWQGLAQVYAHQRNEASATFEQIAKQYPYTYAAFRADHFLHAPKQEMNFKPVWPTENLPLISSVAREPETWLADYTEAREDIPPILVAQLRELASIKAVDDIILLLEMQLPKNSRHRIMLEAWAYLLDGRQDESIRRVKDYFNSLDETWTIESRYQPSREVLKLLFPIHYPNAIQQHAEAAGVSPYLTLGLMRQESSFNPNSISGSSAIGLMQLLVPTANDMVRPGESGGINKLALLQPETNIKLGTRYMAFLSRLLENDPMLVVASYNAGPGAVASWANAKPDVLLSKPDAFVEQIPYDETRHYVHHVFEGMWAYHQLYNLGQ
jgi:soluble lytic murein transglycosylase-like protein